MSQPAPVVKIEKVIVPVISAQDAPIGSKLKVWWRDTKGDGKWYIGSIKSISTDPDTQIMWHEVEYEGFDGSITHNLAKERENGSFPWFIIRKPAAKLDANATQAVDQPTRSSGRITQRPQYHGMIARQLERTTNPVEYFNAAAFAMLGDESTQFEVSEVNQIDGALDKMVQFIEDPPQTFTANKATQKYIDITTPMGTETLYVPQNDDEVSLVKDSDEWMVADTKAIEVGLLSFGKNRKEPASYVKEHNLTVYDAQMARRLKVENGKLAERDARKSRVAVNWVKHKRTNKHKMKFEPSPTYSTSADPFTKKMNIGIATSLKYTKLKADVSGAYRQVTTPRGERAIRCPKHLRTYDANGEEEYIVVDTAVEGEPYSGFEWDVKFLNDRLEIGWRIVPGVPGMMVYKACTMIGEVDDFMIILGALIHFRPTHRGFPYRQWATTGLLDHLGQLVWSIR